jgi:hypothetical protein
MLAPRFTIRAILAATVVCALVLLLASAGYHGHQWAWGVTIGIVSLGIAALAHAVWYGIAWCIARIMPTQATEVSPGNRPPIAEERSV